jgi:hemerythrin-like domain-containing protein
VTGTPSPRASVPKARSEDVPDVLVDCHVRLQKVTKRAAEVAARPDASSEDVREVAEKLCRYFTVVLPLHEEDEEASVFPRLLLRAPELAPTIAGLRLHHAAQAQKVGEVLAVCQALLTSTEADAGLRRRLSATAEALAEVWRTHLASEERDLFPSLKTALSEEERATIREEMRARREHLSR